MRKGILVGRHQLLKAQERAIEELGITLVDKIEQIDNNVATQLEGIDVVVIQALPISILAQILPILQRKGIRVYMFEQDAICRDLLTPEEARKLINERPDCRTGLISINNGEERVRVVEFRRVVEITQIEVKKQTIWEVK